MNNILVAITNFFKNKNVVTILGIIAILGLLYFGYNRTVKAQTEPVTIPVAKVTIQPRTLITSEMVTYIDVPGKSVSANVARNSEIVIGKYSAINSVIPEGSMFYNDVLVKKEDLPDSAFVAVPDGQRPYALAVTTQSTYGNSIFPGSVVDIYMKAIDETGQVVVGRLLSQVKILAVKDSEGNNVFENTAEGRTPATLLFGVPDDVLVLMKRAEYLNSYGVELFPIPYGGAAAQPGELEVDREELVNLINAHSIGYTGTDVQQPINPDTNVDVVE